MPTIDSIPELPERIVGLGRLASNLWWSWNRDARTVFRTIGPELWRAVPDENSAPIAAGDAIRVRAVRGLKLVVERIQD